ncbi:MAG: 2-C-methyl-D-erythritol 2,4-cyclodiphosphate synthase [Flavobacteriales bacterium]|jgi:2-C-methyl-D-erythritol 2,4-cyclodiphosphate synthase|nr:2-C-methyl-D-erythritol 2,4-cyclodiphosphate synthase [Flavobacteriales bacterium]NCG30114.1 2-C-methyl-D-erythritol 2,4-cyclodiphosphate synthase [Bacteroidota bacterium]MBT3964444.1 2-C-methyl-D-erythritol 2,4-cyclodiphosphate synthase [Flavobacteriales bacterium]MBT4705107.1 2-C-methyl-D-erythritol 2,4-cyclodiphosphate synthase [Flavobacteriales bacterium]MBT4930127.1 2-C-methyl-D-erythritol 2,4-cyclodiphosphate synthase [Flavobacteriales bacterium]
MKIRVGFGYDVHQLKEGRSCRLGGVLFESDLGPDGHSDADVLLHAVCDAILGAAGLRDIGFHFPNTDDSFKGADSRDLLDEVVILMTEKGWTIGNIDATLVSEVPKISPKIQEIKESIASRCNIEPDDVGVKATTSEKLGFVGKKEGIEAYAVVLINSTNG